jgi:Ni,Fe-hydrogenase I cytochrome b subunit
MNQTITYYEMTPLQTVFFWIGVIAVVIIVMYGIYLIQNWLERESGGEL